MVHSPLFLCLFALPGAISALFVLPFSQTEGVFPPQGTALVRQQQRSDGQILQQARIGFEKPGVHINLVVTDGPLSLAFDVPVEARQYLQLDTGKQKILLRDINQLRGYVQINSEQAALRYVRLLTSPQTWYLWHKEAQEMEVVESTALSEVLAPGFGDQGIRLDPENGKVTPRWHYDPGQKQFELFKIARDGKYISLKKAKNPDLSTYGDGQDGILSKKFFRAGGFTPPKIVAVNGGYEITRWLFTHGRDWSSDKFVLLIREFVGTDGTYKRTLLQKKDRPVIQGASLILPTWGE